MTREIKLAGALRQTDGKWTKDVEIRAMKGREENILLSTKRDPNSKPDEKDKPLMDFSERKYRILSACTERIGDERRPDGQTSKTHPLYFYNHWKKSFLPDRDLAWMRLRQESVPEGDEYKFFTVCPHCGYSPKGRVICFLQEQEVKEVPLENFVEEGYQETVLPLSKIAVLWKYSDGTMEDNIRKLMMKETDEARTEMFLARCISFDGQPAEASIIEDLWKKDLDFLMQNITERGFGIELSAKVTCSRPLPERGADQKDWVRCGKDYYEPLPLDRLDFFYPSGTSST